MVHFISRRTSWWQPATIAPSPQHLIWRGGQTADAVTQQQWLQDVRAQSSSGDVLVWVHGFNTNRSVALATAKKIKATVTGQGFQGAVVAYDWPTSSEDGLRGALNRLLGLQRMYKKDKETANNMDDTLVKDLRFLFETPGVNVHIMAHSMGCYLTTLGIGHAEQWLGNTKPFGQILLGAADVDQKLLVAEKWGGKTLDRRCTRVTHYHSIKDDILDIGGKVMYGGSKRCGRHGLLPAAPTGFVDVSMAERYAVAHPWPKLRISHTWYLSDDNLLRDVALTLGGQHANAMPTRSGNLNGWVLN